MGALPTAVWTTWGLQDEHVCLFLHAGDRMETAAPALHEKLIAAMRRPHGHDNGEGEAGPAEGEGDGDGEGEVEGEGEGEGRRAVNDPDAFPGSEGEEAEGRAALGSQGTRHTEQSRTAGSVTEQQLQAERCPVTSWPVNEPDAVLYVRCVELHSYSAGGHLLTTGHRDSGSTLTMSVLLSDPGDFCGGEFVTYSEGLPVVHDVKRVQQLRHCFGPVHRR